MPGWLAAAVRGAAPGDGAGRRLGRRGRRHSAEEDPAPAFIIVRSRADPAFIIVRRKIRWPRWKDDARKSRTIKHHLGGTTCLTLLVYHTFSSNVANNVAKSISHIRQSNAVESK